jgi:hypothetical protein
MVNYKKTLTKALQLINQSIELALWAVPKSIDGLIVLDEEALQNMFPENETYFGAAKSDAFTKRYGFEVYMRKTKKSLLENRLGYKCNEGIILGKPIILYTQYVESLFHKDALALEFYCRKCHRNLKGALKPPITEEMPEIF